MHLMSKVADFGQLLAIMTVDQECRFYDSGMRVVIGSPFAALGGVNTAARSKIAYQLEKQAILLALEEGKAV
jgi:hypothetical protein